MESGMMYISMLGNTKQRRGCPICAHTIGWQESRIVCPTLFPCMVCGTWLQIHRSAAITVTDDESSEEEVPSRPARGAGRPNLMCDQAWLGTRSEQGKNQTRWPFWVSAVLLALLALLRWQPSTFSRLSRGPAGSKHASSTHLQRITPLNLRARVNQPHANHASSSVSGVGASSTAPHRPGLDGNPVAGWPPEREGAGSTEVAALPFIVAPPDRCSNVTAVPAQAVLAKFSYFVTTNFASKFEEADREQHLSGELAVRRCTANVDTNQVWVTERVGPINFNSTSATTFHIVHWQGFGSWFNSGHGIGGMVVTVRCAFFDGNLHSRMPLVPTPLLRLKRAGV
jgi:hypothetical protein